jgi:hypothetical protein
MTSRRRVTIEYRTWSVFSEDESVSRHLHHDLRNPVLFDHRIRKLGVLREPLRKEDVKHRDHEKTKPASRTLDVDIEFESKQSKVTERSIQKADCEQREKIQTQVPPDNGEKKNQDKGEE